MDWERTFDSTGSARAEEVVIDSKGNALMVGTFDESVDFRIAELVSAGQGDAFVVKIDPQGNPVWARRLGADAEDEGLGIAVGPEDEVLVTGLFTKRTDWGAGLIENDAEQAIFLTKLDSNGTLLWGQQFGSALYQTGQDVAVDADGNVYLTGDYTAPIDFGGGALPLAGGSDAFLTKFDPDGGLLDARYYGDTVGQMGRLVEVTPEGDLILLGAFHGEADFGGGTLDGGVAMEPALFVARFDSDLNHIWSGTALSTAMAGHHHMDHATVSHSAAAALDGRTLLLGARSETQVGNANDLEAPGLPQAWVQAFAEDGDSVFENSITEQGMQHEGAITSSPSGRLFVASAFLETLALSETSSFVSSGGWDLLVAELDASGNAVAAVRVGSAARSEIGWSVAANDRSLFACGWSRPTSVANRDRVLLVKVNLLKE